MIRRKNIALKGTLKLRLSKDIQISKLAAVSVTKFRTKCRVLKPEVSYERMVF